MHTHTRGTVVERIPTRPMATATMRAPQRGLIPIRPTPNNESGEPGTLRQARNSPLIPRVSGAGSRRRRTEGGDPGAPCGNAHDGRTPGNVSGDDCAGAHDRVLTDANPRQNSRIGTDGDAVANLH